MSPHPALKPRTKEVLDKICQMGSGRGISLPSERGKGAGAQAGGPDQ